jgi:hypothetical protein
MVITVLSKNSHSGADDLNQPLSAELKIAYCWCRLAFIGRIPDQMPGSRRSTLIKRENAHQREATDANAAGFPSFCSSGEHGGNARHGTNALGGRIGRQ